MDPFAPIAAQRRALATVLGRLTPEQWETQSLCDAWTVHELAGHIVVPFEVSMPRVVLEMAKAKAHGAFVDRPLPGVRFVATDVRWSAAEGPDVVGPAAALVTTILGADRHRRPARGPRRGDARRVGGWLVGGPLPRLRPPHHMTAGEFAVTVIDRPFGRHFEDFEVGDVYRHWPGKTITEADDHLSA